MAAVEVKRIRELSDVGALADAHKIEVDTGVDPSGWALLSTLAGYVLAFNAKIASIIGLGAGNGLLERTGTNTFAIRALGAAASTSVLTRADADARYLLESLMTTRGDVVTRGASASQRLALGAATARLKSDGTDVVWGLAGQVDFPASQNASADPNTLDDYEEGNGTLTLAFSTPGDTALVYSTQRYDYTKIGREVTVAFTIITSTFTHTTASGSLSILNLPFATESTSGQFYAAGALYLAGFTSATANQWVLFASSNSQVMRLRYMTTGATGTISGNIGVTEHTTTANVTISAVIKYFAAN